MSVPYERLDAVSMLYPALSFGRRGYLFRLCAVLTEAVDAQVLGVSVRALRPRFSRPVYASEKNVFGLCACSGKRFGYYRARGAVSHAARAV